MALADMVTETSLGAVLQVADQARDEAAKLLELLDEALSSDDFAALSPEAQGRMLKQQKRMFTAIAQLRGLHRAVNLEAREIKAVTAEARLEVDRLHLQLQNLYYEKRHLRNEIVACESYEYVSISFVGPDPSLHELTSSLLLSGPFYSYD
jgi:THO complex subunit 5